MLTRHGRARPLIWLSVWKDELAETRNSDEDACLRRLAEVLPAGVRVTILADRGFADTQVCGFREDRGFGYVIRLRGNIHLTADRGEPHRRAPPRCRLGRPGRAARITADRVPVGAVVCGPAPALPAPALKDPWWLATGDGAAAARDLITLYSRRWTVEPGFRDTKDLRFGLGLSAVRIAEPQRRDRLLRLNAFAVVLLTVLGAAGESLGMDRHLKSNTVKTRTPSLFRQGCMLYDLIPNMPDVRLQPLIQRFAHILEQTRVFTDTSSVI